jgi:hypothetical protein
VILDVVFNHTAEGNEKGPTLSFRGLDNRVYYMLAPLGEYYNYRWGGVGCDGSSSSSNNSAWSRVRYLIGFEFQGVGSSSILKNEVALHPESQPSQPQ